MRAACWLTRVGVLALVGRVSARWLAGWSGPGGGETPGGFGPCPARGLGEEADRVVDVETARKVEVGGANSGREHHNQTGLPVSVAG